MLDGVKSWLASRRGRVAIALVATTLMLPSAGPRLVFDDHLQVIVRSADRPVFGIPYAPFDLFAFARPGQLNDTLIDRGMLLPWWTDPALLIAFFRPLSSLTHVIDGWLWPTSARLMHLHNVAWYAAMLAVIAAVYRRFVAPAWIAGLSFFLYAFDDTHGATVSWIANRNALLAGTFGFLALLFHESWRRDGSRRHLVGALVAFSLGLLGGEAALGALAYIASYALVLDRGDKRSRAWSLVPYAAIVVPWRLVYQWLGYGARGSGAYLDPGREPAAFLAHLPAQMAALIQGQLGIFTADLWFWATASARTMLWAGAVVTIAVIAVLVVPLLRTSATSRFWALGALFALVPSASSIPGDRLLLLPGVGILALLAEVFATFVERSPPLPIRGAVRAAIAVPIFCLFVRRAVVAPLGLPFRAHSMEAAGGMTDFAADTVQRAENPGGRSVIALNPPANILASYLGLILATRGTPVPEHVRWLAPADSELTVTRPSERVLRVRPTLGFFATAADRLYRSEQNPLVQGQRIELADMTVTVGPLAPNGNPAEVDFEFRESLESTRYLWLRWDGASCVPSQPPRVGETVVFPAGDFVKLLFEAVMGSLFRR
jgi:hypothetical protein